MGGTKHQHFIPRSYLKNFALEDNGKFFLEAKNKSEKKPKENLLSIKDICVGKNIYTLPLTEGEDKYALEKYYAENIDAVYPDVYRMLIDPTVINITPEEKTKIIMTTMSLFFRTPKFLNAANRELTGAMTYAAKNHVDHHGNISVQLGEYNFEFHIDNFKAELERLKLRNKILFLKNHLEDWHLFVKSKVKCGICVFKVPNEVKLITSDNPVSLHDINRANPNIFSPYNMIRFPLDSNHFFVIIPEAEASGSNRIYRADRDERFAITTNRDMDDASEDWIMGKPGSIHAHLEDQLRYDARTPENLQYMEDMREKMGDIVDLMNTIKRVGGIAHQEVADKVRELRKKAININNSDLKRWVDVLKENGFSTD